MKVQSASIHFFLGSGEDKEDSDDEEDDVSAHACLHLCLICTCQAPDVKALHHRREINKKTRSGDKKLQKSLNAARKVSPFTWLCAVFDSFTETPQKSCPIIGKFPSPPTSQRSPNLRGKALRSPQPLR